MEKGMAAGMERGMTAGMEKGMSVGIEKGRADMCIEAARNLHKMGMSAEDISKVHSADVDYINSILNEEN